MDDKQINKLIGQGFLVLIAYFIVSAFIDYIIVGLVGLFALQVYQNYQKRK